MNTRLSDLHPNRLWAHFDRLREIPRPSGDEAGARNYVQSIASANGWECRTDSVGNVCVRVPATAAGRSARPVVLQAHLDMVCEKAPGAIIDFSRSGIDARVQGEWVVASETTLGADNGIGVAAALAVCEDPDVVRGPVEILLTVDEEASGTGAAELDPSLVQGRMMINLDSEDDSVLVVGCAGGCSTEIEYAARRAVVPKGHAALRLGIDGLRGGHSGATIHENRGNSIKLLARLLQRLLGQADIYLWSCEGGDKHNAIPREASAVIFVPEGFVDRTHEIASSVRDEAMAELPPMDLALRVAVESAECQTLAPFDCSSTRRLVRLLTALPHGVVAMSGQLPGLVHSSTNLATIRADVDRVVLVSNSRSLRESSLRAVLDQIDAICRLSGADTTESGYYPPWRADLSSSLVLSSQRTFERVVGRPPALTTIHAGLECGVIAQRIPEMEMVSIGPCIEGAHAPGERVSIPSVRRFYDVLAGLITAL